MGTSSVEEPNWFTVFRTDEDNVDWIYKEMTEGRLRQGWGAPGFALTTPDGLRTEKGQWEERYKVSWEVEPSPMRYSILIRMLKVKEGDVVVVPKMPESNQFTIARVSGEYWFEADEDRKDFGHIVPVRRDSVRTFGYRADNEAFLISGLFSRANHRPAVSFCNYADQVKAANRLLQRPNNPTSRPQKELAQAAIDDAFMSAAVALRDEVKNWNGPRFEEVVRQAFRDQGYTVKPHRRYDRKGADADILVSPPANRYSLFLPAEIVVQVKWKEGLDEADEESVMQIIKWAQSEGSDAVKCVISSASGFTDDAHELATANNVVLIGGLQTMCFLLGATDRYRNDWD